MGANNAYFTSSSTQNGKRRFLAIGNFFDTTNSAYYLNSVSRLRFDLSKDKNILVKKANLKLYKYANAYFKDVNIKLYGQEGNFLKEVFLDNGDYDFDVANFEITDYIKNKWTQNIEFNLKVENAHPYEGVAVCSGNFTDSICLEKYHPKLEIKYIYNTKGSLKNIEFDKNTKYNSTYSSENVKCQKDKGCNIFYKFYYQDIEANAQIYLISKNKKTGKEQIQKTLHNNSDVLMNFNYGDGQYEVLIKVIDGAYEKIQKLHEFEIDTLPPHKPVVLNHSQIGSRSGVYIDFEKLSEKGKFHIHLCKHKDVLCKTELAKVETDKLSINVKSQSPLITGVLYDYQIYGIDDFGNQSEKTIISILQNNKLIELHNIKLSEKKISPKNQDEKFDITKITYQSDEDFYDKGVIIRNSQHKIIGKKRFEKIKNEFNGKIDNYLSCGKYFIQITGKDKYGYNIADHKRIEVEIDNTAPRLY